tara:strand:- start:1494 stop:2174 length:681 start_codon:yes stop_codon:yes gene_type:complete
MESVMKPSEFSISNVEYSDIRPMGTTGAKQMYLNYRGGKSIVLHTPKMRLPFGVGKFEEGSIIKYTIDMSFNGMDNDPKMKTFYDAIHAIDEKILSDTKQNSLTWLRKKSVSDDVARTLYTPSLKYSKDKDTGEPNTKYPPTIKAKLPFYDGKFACSVFDNKKTKLEGDFTKNIDKGQYVTAIIKCGGVWFSGGKYGVSWKVEQLLIHEGQEIIGYAFRDDDEEDN